MTQNSKNTCVVYKNDLKFNEFDISVSEFESEGIKEIYNNYKSKPKLELRIKDSEMENYEYFDLSKLDLTDELVEKLFCLKKIIFILKKIKFLDLNNNKLKKFPDLKLVLTGGGYTASHNWLINLGIIQKKYLIKIN